MIRTTETRQIGMLRQRLRQAEATNTLALADLDRANAALDTWRGIAIVLAFALALSWAF
jgi:hypothetical protein